MSNSIIVEKSEDFAVRIIRLYKQLKDEKKDYILSRQIVRYGTSIGAYIHEAKQAQSDADFISKLNIALKEASETEYWLELLYRTDYLNEHEYLSLKSDCEELGKLLTSIIKTSKNKLKRQYCKLTEIAMKIDMKIVGISEAYYQLSIINYQFNRECFYYEKNNRLKNPSHFKVPPWYDLC